MSVFSAVSSLENVQPHYSKHFRCFTAKSLGLKYDDQECGWASPKIAAHVLVT